MFDLRSIPDLDGALCAQIGGDQSGLTFWPSLDLWQVPDHLLAAFIYSDRTTGDDLHWDGREWWVSRDGSAITDQQKAQITA